MTRMSLLPGDIREWVLGVTGTALGLQRIIIRLDFNVTLLVLIFEKSRILDLKKVGPLAYLEKE